MNDSEKWDRILKQALTSTAEPEEELNQRILNRFKERNKMKSVNKKRISAVALVAVFTLVMSITAFAATQYFSSKQVAEHLGEQILAEAFESNDAIEINQSIASGNYNYTLHGIVSGAGLNGLNNSEQEINPDRTYAVVSIARADGAPMPKTSDPEYGSEPLFISPLIKGQKPWQVNIFTMNGGYNEIVLDGIMYRLIECDGIEMFADRGVYLAISSGSSFYNNEAYAYNESTGAISPKSDYDGTSILFDLPLDKKKADHDKAEAYLNNLLNVPSADTATDLVTPAVPVDDAEAALNKKMEELKKKLKDGKVIPESIKEVTYDKHGRLNYEYDSWSVKLSPELMFKDGQTGDSEEVSFSEGDGFSWALVFSKDENGVITGRIVDLN